MKNNYLVTLLLLCVTSVALFSASALAESDEARIAATLNSFHQAAADAEATTYFNLLSDDAVFLGTDASERWTKAEFESFVVPYFSKGQGWLYTPTERHISLVKLGQVAFFDELLLSDSYGVCRGSGILIKTQQGWKISQYNLSIPMPNGLAKSLVGQIKSFEQGK
jgi:ketosteroid isomerase-like protein